LLGFGQLNPPVVYPELDEWLPIFFADDFRLNRTLGLAKKDFRSSRVASDSTLIMTLETEVLRNIEKIALRKIYCLKLLLEKHWQRV